MKPFKTPLAGPSFTSGVPTTQWFDVCYCHRAAAEDLGKEVFIWEFPKTRGTLFLGPASGSYY